MYYTIWFQFCEIHCSCLHQLSLNKRSNKSNTNFKKKLQTGSSEIFPGNIWVFPKIGVPQNAWFIMENPIKWMIWGYPYFWKHPYRHLGSPPKRKGTLKKWCQKIHQNSAALPALPADSNPVNVICGRALDDEGATVRGRWAKWRHGGTAVGITQSEKLPPPPPAHFFFNIQNSLRILEAGDTCSKPSCLVSMLNFGMERIWRNND